MATFIVILCLLVAAGLFIGGVLFGRRNKDKVSIVVDAAKDLTNK